MSDANKSDYAYPPGWRMEELARLFAEVEYILPGERAAREKRERVASKERRASDGYVPLHWGDRRVQIL